MGALTLILQGCGRDERAPEKPSIPASAPASYMKDPEFRQQLEEKRKELQAIVKERKPLADRMQELVKEHGEDLAALQKIDEWNELHKKVVELNAKYEETRKRQLKIAARKLKPAGGSGETPLLRSGAVKPAGEAAKGDKEISK